MNFLEVAEASVKREGDYVLKNISFIQQAHQKLAISGATGSGKTSLLKLIGGLLHADEGMILFREKRVAGPHETLIPGHPRIAYLSQDFELKIHYRVHEILDMSNRLSQEEAAVIYDICRINHLFDRWSDEVSGGERQRIALARLLVQAPELLLLDEPYSNIDSIHKEILREVVNQLSAQLNISMIMVSHDPADVLSWADRVIVLQNGHILQAGSPEEIYRRPADVYVASLFGKYNVLSVALAKKFSPFADIEMERINTYLRPSDFYIDEQEGVEAVVKGVYFMGSYYELQVDAGNFNLTVHSLKRFATGEVIHLQIRS